jgi:hypothetical protein
MRPRFRGTRGVLEATLVQAMAINYQAEMMAPWGRCLAESAAQLEAMARHAQSGTFPTPQ